MQHGERKYIPPVVSSYGQEGRSEDLANLVVKRKLAKKSNQRISVVTDKLYGYEAGPPPSFFAVYQAAAANVAAVVNAAVYSNAVVATLAVAVAAVVTFPGNMQDVTSV